MNKKFIALFLLAVFGILIVAAKALPVSVPNNLVETPRFPNHGLYVSDGKIYKFDKQTGVTVQEKGEDNWLSNVYVTNIYFITNYFLAVEGVFDDYGNPGPWLMLSAFDVDSDDWNTPYVTFGRYITANATNAKYVDYYHLSFTNAQGQNCISNIHGDLFWPPPACS